VSLSLTPDAEQELFEGALFYAREAGADLGRAFLSEFERSATLLAEQPRLGAIWRGQIRRLPLRRFPYSIVYDLSKSEVRVLAVAHQSRKPGFWRGRS
jgi:plasmid stabilization system protein ParE